MMVLNLPDSYAILLKMNTSLPETLLKGWQIWLCTKMTVKLICVLSKNYRLIEANSLRKPGHDQKQGASVE